MQKLTEYKPKQDRTEEAVKWYVIDAQNVRLGKLSSKAAQLLIGKDSVDHVDYQPANTGVVIINSDKVSFFHKRSKNKIYYSHSGYPGGFKAVSLGEQMDKDSRKVIESAVSGMLPKNKLRKQFMTKLRVFKDSNHNLEAQQPEEVKVT